MRVTTGWTPDISALICLRSDRAFPLVMVISTLGPPPPPPLNLNLPFHLMRTPMLLICGSVHSHGKKKMKQQSSLCWRAWDFRVMGNAALSLSVTTLCWSCMDVGLRSDHETRDEAGLRRRERLRDFKIKFSSDLISSKQFTVLINWVYYNITQV